MEPILLKIAFNELSLAIFGFQFAFLFEKPHCFFMFHLACKTQYDDETRIKILTPLLMLFFTK